ncbi:MAG: hypothetical protein FJ276_33060, partial [Planctomycetes bacterium]|nr:hypothetical protein [Planctomycetota bacterium]
MRILLSSRGVLSCECGGFFRNSGTLVSALSGGTRPLLCSGPAVVPWCERRGFFLRANNSLRPTQARLMGESVSQLYDVRIARSSNCMRLTVVILLGVWFLFFPRSLPGAEYWNQYRGPAGNGQAQSNSLPLEWSETKGVIWKTPIHGKAWSSPVVWGDQVWMTSATEDGRKLYAICVDARTGRVTHNRTVFDIAEPMYCIAFNSYASPTPVVEQGRLWVHFGSAGTACLDTASGEVVWARQDLPCDHFRGPGSSPIVFRDLLILTFDGFDLQYVTALDKRSGNTVWKTNRGIEYGTTDGDFKKSYSTPVVFEHQGRLQLVSPTAAGTIAYDPLTGRELWKVHHGGYNAAARPLYSHGLVIINLEGGLRLMAVRPDGTGDVSKTHVVWTCNRATPTRPSQLIVRDHLYMVND